MGSRIIQGNKRLQAGICFEKHNRLYFNFFFIDMYDIEKRFLTEMLKLKFTKKKKKMKKMTATYLNKSFELSS